MRKKGSKFFFEKKNQKTFICLEPHRAPSEGGGCSGQITKVFWFFFSKKNLLPAFFLCP
jgi:hypothetical protein